MAIAPRLRRFLAAAGDLAARAWGWVPVSWVGAAAIGAAVAAMMAARDASDYVLHSLSLAVLGAVAVSALVTLVAAGRLWLAVRRAPAMALESLDTEAPVRTGFVFPSLAAWPFAQVAMRWSRPARVDVELLPDRGRYRESIVAHERGRFDAVERAFTVTDIFGLARVSFRRRWTQPLRIAPTLGRYSLALALRHTGGDGYSHPSGSAEGEYIEMRRYTHGDPLRLVLWKHFARTRELLVRTPERAISPQPSTIAFLVAGAGDEPAASTARRFLEEGLLGDRSVFSADGASRPADDLGEAVEQIVDSASFKTDGGAGLRRFLGQVDRSQLGSCVIFAPSEPGPWIDRLAEFTRALPAPPTVIVGVDGRVDVERPKSIRRLLWTTAEPPSPALRQLPALLRRLRATGVDVRVVHRPTGRVLAETQLEGLAAAGVAS